ncbi:uncharacterized protein LOC133749985 [Lepus europaeus]|uniref:uncharacterized protein LOC133749985 n=1 Tax=Lepus europaeus TaxID=9983 RepID=UPI002B473A77|nr:uncharacterized protein LOC133749985 [Lepus europaeus]
MLEDPRRPGGLGGGREDSAPGKDDFSWVRWASPEVVGSRELLRGPARRSPVGVRSGGARPELCPLLFFLQGRRSLVPVWSSLHPNGRSLRPQPSVWLPSHLCSFHQADSSVSGSASWGIIIEAGTGLDLGSWISLHANLTNLSGGCRQYRVKSGLVIDTPVMTPTSDGGVPGLHRQLRLLILLPANADPGTQQAMARGLGSLPPTRETRMELQALAWTGPSRCGHWAVNQQMGDFSPPPTSQLP